MTAALLLAGILDDLGQWQKILAVVWAVVGFVVGAFVLGALTRLIVRVVSGEKVPRVPMIVIRVLGGVVVAWLAWLWATSGSGGRGGPGGPESGGYDKPGSGNGSFASTTEPGKDKESSSGSLLPDQPLRIEVLDNAVVKKTADQGKADAGYFYRIRDGQGSKLLTLAEVKKQIDPEQTHQPWRPVVIAVYKQDGPNRWSERVTDLEEWVNSLLVKDASGKPIKVKAEVIVLPEATPLQ
jgi:hypothetical protein